MGMGGGTGVPVDLIQEELEALVAGRSVVQESYDGNGYSRLYLGIERGPDMIANIRYVFLGRGFDEDKKSIYRISAPPNRITKGGDKYLFDEGYSGDSAKDIFATFVHPRDQGYEILDRQLREAGL